jgi:peptidoglycan/LPS O-acetylase OafA/YrhL
MSERRIGLDYVRAAAILLVVGCHAGWFGAEAFLAYPPGILGVELFFVLSGYLIGGIFLKAVHRAGDCVSPRLLWTFWVRRWLRTVPNYFLFLPVYVILSKTMEWPLHVLTFTQNLAWPNNSPFGISWSLCVEEWFYLLFPLAFLLLFSVFRSVRTSFVAAAAALFIVPAVLRFALGTGQTWSEAVHHVVVYRLDAIMWGVLLAAIQRYRVRLFNALQNPGFVAAGVAGMCATMCWLAARFLADGAEFRATPLDALISCGFDLSAALVLPAAAISKGLSASANRLALATSQWSYSMYLAHIPVIGVMFKVSRVFAPEGISGLAWAVPTLAAIYATSAAVYFGFELPILKWRDRWVPAEARAVAASQTSAVPVSP